VSQLLDCVVWTVHAAPRRPFSRRSRPAIWFQLANVWLTTHFAPSSQQLAVGDGDDRSRESNRVGVGRTGFEPAASESAILVP